MFALVVTRTYGGLRASCSCGEDLGESVTWERSQASHAEHVAQDHTTDRTETTTDARGLYVCGSCHQANLLPVTPNQPGTVLHRGMGRHSWLPSNQPSEPEPTDA